MNICSRYDPKENKWSKVSPMTTRRLGVAVAVLGGYLYAIGGSDGQSPLNTVERYDPRHNKWSPVSPMSTRRKHLGCAVFNNLIYAVGGRDDCMELSSAERYNPHTNTWSPIVAMTSRRSGVSFLNVFSNSNMSSESSSGSEQATIRSFFSLGQHFRRNLYFHQDWKW